MVLTQVICKVCHDLRDNSRKSKHMQSGKLQLNLIALNINIYRSIDCIIVSQGKKSFARAGQDRKIHVFYVSVILMAFCY